MVDAYTVIKLTGYVNLLSFFLVIITCRCIRFWKIAKAVLGEKIFTALNSRHCLYWYVFIPSVIIHVYTTQNPGWVQIFG